MKFYLSLPKELELHQSRDSQIDFRFFLMCHMSITTLTDLLEVVEKTFIFRIIKL